MREDLRPVTRRGVLHGMAAVGAAIWSAGLRATTARQWIDVHHHFIPPGYREFYASARTSQGSPAVMPPTSWDLAADLADMDRAGTSTAVLSMFVPPQLGTPETRARLARDINEGGAKLVVGHPGRFGLFAALPLPDIEESLREIAYAADVLHADGFAVHTNVGGRWLGDPALNPIFEELHRRRTVLFVHPTTATCCQNLVSGVPDNIIEYQTDTSRAIASLVFSGASLRYSNVQFLFAHGGGTVPFLVERFLGGTAVELVPGIKTQGQQGPYVPQQPPGGVLPELRRFHYDTAQCANPVAMQALKTLVPVTQIHFGTDYFYRTATETSVALQGCGVFGERELEAIAFGNTSKLLPRLVHERRL